MLRLSFIKFLLIISCFLGGCKTSQKAKEKWLNSPNDNDYYIGIGTASKNDLEANEYLEKAKENALNDLSENISVSVSAVSLLNQMEDDKTFTESFNSTIHTTSKNYLSNVEVLDSWENKKEYWIKLKIEKKNYAITKEQKKKEAVKKALLFYDKGLVHDKKNEIKLAFNFYLKALHEILPFANESLKVNHHNKTILLGTEIYTKILSLYLETNFSHKKAPYIIGSGQIHYLIYATRNCDTLKDIPLLIAFADQSQPKENYYIDHTGKCLLPIPRFSISSNKTYDEIKISLNFNQIIANIHDDLLAYLFHEIPKNDLTIIPENKERSFAHIKNSISLHDDWEQKKDQTEQIRDLEKILFWSNESDEEKLAIIKEASKNYKNLRPIDLRKIIRYLDKQSSELKAIEILKYKIKDKQRCYNNIAVTFSKKNKRKLKKILDIK